MVSGTNNSVAFSGNYRLNMPKHRLKNLCSFVDMARDNFKAKIHMAGDNIHFDVQDLHNDLFEKAASKLSMGIEKETKLAEGSSIPKRVGMVARHFLDEIAGSAPQSGMKLSLSV